MFYLSHKNQLSNLRPFLRKIKKLLKFQLGIFTISFEYVILCITHSGDVLYHIVYNDIDYIYRLYEHVQLKQALNPLVWPI